MTTLKAKDRGSLDQLLVALADGFDEEGRPGGDAAAAALRAARDRPYREVPSTAEPEPLLELVCKQPNALPIAALVLACRHLLSWWHWAGEGLAPGISSSLYTAELVGPTGHLEDDHVRVGFLISESATDYPVSSHAGEETYLVVAGVAEWSVDGGLYRTHAPGTLIHHPAWTPHGRRTLNEPFLGAWRWSGDLDFSKFNVDKG